MAKSKPYDPPRKLMRIDAVAVSLDTTRQQVYRLIQSGRLKSVRLGKRAQRITTDSYEALVSGAA